jgi:GT2 family glycosyltransferase
MSEDVFRPVPDSSRSEEVKPSDVRQGQAEQAKKKLELRAADQSQRSNPIVTDETYGALQEEDRVVMRHKIALNLDSFRASSEGFEARPERHFPELSEDRPPFFSVVIANYNGEVHLPVVLEALRRQTFSDFEVIVVDDASHDDSVSLVERGYPEVRLLVSRRNAGFAAACNTGAAAARGRMIVMLNSDTEPEDGWLEALSQAVVRNPNAGAFASKMLLFEHRNVLHTAGDEMGRDGLARNRGAWRKDDGSLDDKTAIFSACGGAAAYRREVWQTLQGFDEDLWMYLEDVDLGFRARLAGWVTVFAPEARVYHHLSASGGETLASYYVGRNSLWVLAKNMPDSLLLRNGIPILLGQLRISRDAVRNLRGAAARARLRGQIAGLLGLSRQFAKRRLIQDRRVVDDAEIARLLV